MMSFRFLAVPALLFVLAAPAAAQTSDTVDFVLQKLGLREEEKDPIDYRERAPLVVPPQHTLVAPQERASAADPRWPQDPDVVRRRKAEEERRKPRWTEPSDGAELRAIRDGGLGIRSEGLPRSQGGGQGNHGAMFDRNSESRGFSSLAETSLFSIFSGRKSNPEVEEVYQEPERRSLVEPPRGMRSAAGTGPVRATRETGSKFIDPTDPRDVARQTAR